MAKLGSPKVSRYPIGTAEVRIGPLSEAGRLTQDHSIGLIDSATFEYAFESVDLLGGFPQEVVDTAVVKRTASMTAALREYSRRNLNVMMGNAVQPFETADVSSTVDTTAAIANGATSVTVAAGDGALFAVGDVVVVYSDNDRANVHARVVSAITVDTLTLSDGLVAPGGGANVFSAGEPVSIYKTSSVALGAVDTVNYFSVQLVQVERGSSRPMGYNFWKAAIDGGMSQATNATDFPSTDFKLKILQPAAAEYAAGGPLAHLANIIPQNPVGMLFVPSDAA